MKCGRAQKILNNCQWDPKRFSRDADLMEHLRNCPECGVLVTAENNLTKDLNLAGNAQPKIPLTINTLKNNIEHANNNVSQVLNRVGYLLWGNHLGRAISTVAAVILFAFIAWMPFNFQVQVGYGISISGVDKEIALDSKGVFPLLDALGMQKDKSANLKGSLARQEIQLYVGDCSETCNLQISDLKTEKDVDLVIKAILEIGCCEIDEVFPIFRDQSSSLLEHMTKKLFS